MTVSGDAPIESRLCSLVSAANGEDPIGTATPFERCLTVEVKVPWERDVTASGLFPEGLVEVVEDARAHGLLDKVTAVMHDPEYSRAGFSRVLFFRRPPGPFAAYEKDDFLVPDAEVVGAVEALLAGPDELARFEHYRQDTSGVREILVCTHGSRDACCGKFGFPLYRALREGYARPDSLRVWRSSHIGGHRFSPTLMDLPEGRLWGRVEPEALDALVRRSGAASDLAPFYRGWAGLETKFEQVAEREILKREGWDWTAYRKTGRVLEQGDGRAVVRIEYAGADGAPSGAYEATVEPTGTVLTLESSGTAPLSEVEQYAVSRLEKVS